MPSRQPPALPLAWALVAAVGCIGPAATAQTESQNTCLGRVLQAYNAEKLGRLGSGTLEMPSVDQIVALRRSQESHCLKVTQCLADPADTAEARLDRAKVFASCLERQAMEQYDARRR